MFGRTLAGVPVSRIPARRWPVQRAAGNAVLVAVSLFAATRGAEVAGPSARDNVGVTAGDSAGNSAGGCGSEETVAARLDPDGPLLRDARSYAADYGVSLEEAVRHLRSQVGASLGGLETRLTEKERDTFAGLWIEHQPEHRYVVLFAGGGGDDPAVHRARTGGGTRRGAERGGRDAGGAQGRPERPHASPTASASPRALLWTWSGTAPNCS